MSLTTSGWSGVAVTSFGDAESSPSLSPMVAASRSISAVVNSARSQSTARQTWLETLSTSAVSPAPAGCPTHGFANSQQYAYVRAVVVIRNAASQTVPTVVLFLATTGIDVQRVPRSQRGLVCTKVLSLRTGRFQSFRGPAGTDNKLNPFVYTFMWYT